MPDPTPPTSTPPRSTPPSADPSSFMARAAAAAASASRAANAAIASASATLAEAKASREAKRAAARSRPAVTGTRPDPSAPRPASVVVKPPVTPEQRERGRAVGLAAVGCASLIALVVTVGIFLPALGALTSGSTIRPVDAASLPNAILVCDRDYERTDAVLDSIVQVRARDGKDPTVVGVSNSCPAGVCMTEGVCLTVVYVATTDDRYAKYELQGGP